MSEHQHYALLAIDHPLTEAQIRRRRRVSLRADISETRFRVHHDERQARRRTARQRRETAAAAAERRRQLDDLAGHEEAAWRRVGRWVAEREPQSNAAAAALLVDLRDPTKGSPTEKACQARLARLETRHARKITFLQRRKRAGQRTG